jgi:NAD(P)-dependent dehydrogenase (short-subunit alcohol dehydrogenase family)
MARYPELAARVVLVTGAARGIGRAMALAFAEQGCVVVINDVLEDEAHATADDCRSAGASQAEAQLADVADRDACEAMVAAVIDRHGRLDVLAANAGINPTSSFLELGHDVWERIQRTNMWSLFHCGQPAARQMATQGAGSILVTGSPACNETYRDQTHYATAKAGLQMLAWGMAWELGPLGIRTNIVHPGWIETELNREYLWADPGLRERVVAQIPLRRTGLPADVARAAVWLASDEAAYVNGATLEVDGGLVVGRVKA